MKAKSMLFRSLWYLLFLLAIAACPAAVGKIIYVDDDAAGANNGTSWKNAYIYLQDSLADANSAEKPVEMLREFINRTREPDKRREIEKLHSSL